MKMESEASPTSTYFRGPPELIHTVKDDGVIWEQFHLTRNVALDPGNVTLLQRVDHLDIKLSTMEDKVPGEQSSISSLSPRTVGRPWSGPPTPSSLERRCKTAESVLVEIEEKGTLIERVSELEKRVSKLQGMISPRPGAAVPITLFNVPDSSGTHDDVDLFEHDKQPLPSFVSVENDEAVKKGANDPKKHCQYSEGSIYTRDNEKQDFSKVEQEAITNDTCLEQEKGSSKQRFKMRPKQIKKWLSKRLHASFPGFAQAKSMLLCHCNHPCSKRKHCRKAGKHI